MPKAFAFAAVFSLVAARALLGQIDALEKQAAELLPHSAVLKTDPEARRLLQRAEELARGDRPDLAAALYQKVLDEAGPALVVHSVTEPAGPTSSPLAVFRSLAETVEQSLLQQPAAVLAAYRTAADAAARALLSSAGEFDERALATIVRRYFLSTLGDDAALKLASLALDRHDFATAFALLQKISATYPHPSVSPVELQARLAVAAAGVEDWPATDKALAQLRAAASTAAERETVRLIAAQIEKAKSGQANRDAPEKAWRMAFGNPGRTGRMPALSASATQGDLAELASVAWPLPIRGLGSPGETSGNADTIPSSAEESPSRAAAMAEARSEIIQHWRAGGWRPAANLRFEAGRVYFKTADRLVCYDKASFGQQPLWQSAWQNRYELDPLTQRLALAASQFQGGLPRQAAARPSSLAEILLFGDRVHQALDLVGGDALSLEGRRATSAAPPNRQQPAPWASSPRRARTNWLTAYEADGGKAQWTRTAAANETEASGSIGFLAAPVPCGDELVVPVTDGGTIWLYGLDRHTGRTQWSVYLCDEPRGGAHPWAKIVPAVSGREVYLTCGCGVAFAVDTVSRSIRWATVYRRDGQTNAALQNVLGDAGSILDFNGWDDDVALIQGRAVIVLASDGDRLLALDRRTGERLWESPRTLPTGADVGYALGLHGHNLLVAGKNAVRRYDAPSGRLLQERPIADSFGRGCLTGDAIYVPSGTAVLKFDIALEKPPTPSKVAITTDEPLGNLYSDGQRLWVVGAGRVYTLTPLEQRFAELNTQIATGDEAARLDRLRLYLKLGRIDDALSDLRAAHARWRTELPAGRAAERLLAILAEQNLPQEQPVVVLSLLADLKDNFSPAAALSTEGPQQLADVLASCIAALRQHSSSEAVKALVSAAPLMHEDHLLNAASFALNSVATAAEKPQILAALNTGSAPARLIAVRAAVRLDPASTRPPLRKMLSSSDDRVRLDAARALANLGEQANILTTLVSLLESQSVAVRSRSHHTLVALSRQQIPFAAEGSPADRAAAVRAWRQWLAAAGRTARLALPLRDKAEFLGRILVVGPSALIEFDADHRERWRRRLPGAGWGCQGLPDGHRLVALNSHSSVIEFDEGGREVWKKDRLPAPPTSVERLENGHTLVACGNAEQIVEIAPDGALSKLATPGNPVWAQRLESGNTLVALQQPIQRVVELDTTGHIVWEARTSGNPPWHAVRLENGNTLVTLAQARKVIEFDPTGKTIVWSTQVSLIHPLAAQRLPSGTTLVADQTGLREIDASGKQIIRHLRLPNLTGLSCY